MSKKKLSAEEKKIKMLELFHETNDVYQLKDLERLAPQEKGIVLQSVKIVIQELVDNDLVKCEKIAGSLYYWSFPSENLKKLERQLNEVKQKTNQIQQRINSVQSEFEKDQETLEDMPAIEAITREISVLQEEKVTLEKQAAQYKQEVNYEELKEKQIDTKKFLEAANRWTDNIFMTKSWCKSKFDKQEKELNKAFGIPSELDYVD